MWDRTGEIVEGLYMGVPYHGVVSHSRVKLGGAVQHAVDLLDSITVFGEDRDSILILETDQFTVKDHIDAYYE